MTVQELIKELSKYNPETEVWKFDGEQLCYVEVDHTDDIFMHESSEVTSDEIDEIIEMLEDDEDIGETKEEIRKNIKQIVLI